MVFSLHISHFLTDVYPKGLNPALYLFLITPENEDVPHWVNLTSTVFRKRQHNI